MPGRSPSSVICASAWKRIPCSTCRRSWLAESSSCAICAARAGSAVRTSSRPASARYRRPAAFSRGASANATARSSTFAGSTPCDRHQRAQTGLGGARQRPQPAAYERAVLADQRHDVGDRRQRHQVEVLLELAPREHPPRTLGLPPARLPPGGGVEQCLGELVCDRRRTQLGARVAAQSRVHDRRLRQLPVGARRVMVGDHHLDAELARESHLLDRRDRAVHGDQQPCAPRREPPHGRRVQAIAVACTVGQVEVDVRPQAPQRAHEHRGRADAVDVVVAVDRDPRALRRRGRGSPPPPRRSPRTPAAGAPRRRGETPARAPARPCPCAPAPARADRSRPARRAAARPQPAGMGDLEAGGAHAGETTARVGRNRGVAPQPPRDAGSCRPRACGGRTGGCGLLLGQDRGPARYAFAAHAL